MYRKTTMKNGIRVITDTMPEVRAISMGVLIDASPRNETQEKSGLAHMAEHLMFSGTINRDAMQIARLIDTAGGHMGAFTARDYTCYSATVLDDYYTYSLDLFGDILLNSTFPEESMEREKEVVLREIAAGTDNPAERSHDLLKAFAMRRFPFGRSIAGSPDTVKALTREDVIYFVHEHYLPTNMVVAAAGNVDHQKFVDHVQDAFWSLMGETQPVDSGLPREQTQRIAVEHMPVSQVYFSLGIEAFPYAHPDRYGLHLLNNVLGGGISSRLFRRMREERGLVYDIRSEYHAYRDEGLLIVEGSTAPEHLSQVLGLTLVELWRLITGDDPIDEDEFWKAKMQIRGQHLLAAEDSNTRMSRLLTQEFYFGHQIPADEILAQIDAVDNRMLQRLADEALVEALRQVKIGVVGPVAPEHYSTASIEELLANFE